MTYLLLRQGFFIQLIAIITLKFYGQFSISHAWHNSGLINSILSPSKAFLVGGKKCIVNQSKEEVKVLLGSEYVALEIQVCNS